MNAKRFATSAVLVGIMFVGNVAPAHGAAKKTPPPVVELTEGGQKLFERYDGMLKSLKAELTGAMPTIDAEKRAAFLSALNPETKKAEPAAKKDAKPAKNKKGDSSAKKVESGAKEALAELELTPFLSNDQLDQKLVKCVILNDATPHGLAEFAQQGSEQAALIDQLLGDPALMKQMLIADGANDNKYGPAMAIYTAIQKASPKAKDGIFQRLALAISLEHALPMSQGNPKAATDAPKTIDPVKRYLAMEKAHLAGELDPAFKDLTTWDLRFVVDGEEPDETHAWGREMLGNYRPDIINGTDYNWRYVRAVASDVKYGSGDVKFDRPELQNYQNILMNGGVCGRRAFFGRFILRSFGIPTTARPQTGHAALVHWTPKGWVPCLGGGWGAGRTATQYGADLNFLATTQARALNDSFLQVKRAQWLGDVAGETPNYGLPAKSSDFWYSVSLYTQRDLIEKAKAKAIAAVGTELGESNDTGERPEEDAAKVAEVDNKIDFEKDGSISIPAAAFSKPANGKGDFTIIKSLAGGMQINLSRFGREGVTILRGGAWRGGPGGADSGSRILSGGYGAYNNWGFRAAMSADEANPPQNVTLDLGDGVTMDFVYIKPGKFTMGGESTKDDKFSCVELPKHEVQISKGYYMGKYEVTQAQYQAMMEANPSKGGKEPNCPADTIGEGNAIEFCAVVGNKTGRNVRLPTEAEWEFAARAGSTTKYFFGDDAKQLGDYAWFNENDGGKSHPVGQKKPNPWGLYDIYGNVCERVSDVYARDYYAKSPKVDPTGPVQRNHSELEYTLNAPQAGTYTLTARVVTNNYNQAVNVATADMPDAIKMALPFTCGQWKECAPVTVTLKQGENVLKFSRNDPPQAGIAIKSFTLKPAK